MASTIFSNLDSALLTPILNFVTTTATGVSTWATGPLAVAFTIYVMVQGGSILLGKTSDPLAEFLVNCVRYGVILTLIGSAGTYSSWVVDLAFNDLPTEIVNAMGSGQPPSASAFDALANQGMGLAASMWKAAGTWDIAQALVNTLCGMVVAIFVAALAASGYAVWIFSKVALALCLAVGPIFVALAMFPATRRLTESWIGALANYLILQVLVVALLSIIMSVLQTQIAQQTGGLIEPLGSMVPVCAICLVALYLFHQLPAIASSLAGGGAALGFGWSGRQDGNQSFAAIASTQAWQAARRGAGAAYARLSSGSSRPERNAP